eukprot:15197685-Heterocapsa_arctica.AAC.1
MCRTAEEPQRTNHCTKVKSTPARGSNNAVAAGAPRTGGGATGRQRTLDSANLGGSATDTKPQLGGA